MTSSTKPSIRRRTLVTLFGTAGLGVLVAGLLFFAFLVRNTRQTTRQDLASLGEVLAFNAAPFVVFDSPEQAGKLLEGLRGRPDITRALIQRADGSRVAAYARGKGPSLNPATMDHLEGDREVGGRLVISTPIQSTDGHPVGRLLLESDQVAFHRQIRLAAIAIAITLLGVGGGILLLSLRLQRALTGPVLDLAQLAEAVAEKQDFSLRATSQRTRELDILAGAFNDMLAKIQIQDELLEDHLGQLARELQERKQAEAARSESERKTRAIFDLSYGFVGLLSPQGFLLEANRTALEFAGVTLEEVQGKPYWEGPWWQHSSDERARLQTAIGQAAAGATVRYESTHAAADGSIRFVDFSLKPVFDEAGQVTLVIPEGRDITERKRAEEALQLTVAQLRASLENTPNVAIQWYDDEGRVTFWNPASEAMYGWSSEEATGKTLDQLIHTPEDAAEFLRILDGIRSTGEPFGPYEAPIQRRDGSSGWVMATTYAMPMGEGRVGFVCMDVDITERKRAEEAKGQLHAQLIQAQKMEVVGRLAGGVAHDFNNMLGVILGRADLAMTMLEPDSRAHASLAEIVKAAQHSADLTRQLLAFARKQTVAPRVLDLNQTVEGMLQMLRRLIGEDINLTWMPSPSLWELRLDPSQIDQVLANLCVNSRDAIQGVGRISIETCNVSLDARFCEEHLGAVPGDYVLLTVSDTGCGMTPEVLEHIFEPFFTTKGIGQGTGLGLATVYGIVRQNEGFLTVHSEPGRGSSFRIYLPRTLVQEALSTTESVATRIPRGQGEALLVVEDDASLLGLAVDALESLGYRVVPLGTPGEAISLPDDELQRASLLITDVVMPEMNGLELADRLCQRKPGLKCLFVSGYSADIIANQGFLPEGMAFLQKPFTIHNLAIKVQAILLSD